MVLKSLEAQPDQSLLDLVRRSCFNKGQLQKCPVSSVLDMIYILQETGRRQDVALTFDKERRSSATITLGSYVRPVLQQHE